MTSEQPVLRAATAEDAGAIASLHAESWRRHYRGVYTDAFLDGEVVCDRLQVWTERLSEPRPRTRTFVAEAGDGLVGFGHLVLDADPVWGALLENLHVLTDRRRGGVGSRLLRRAVREARAEQMDLHLWVHEFNDAAQAFYAARGGRHEGCRAMSEPGGVPGRLHGSPRALRFTWRCDDESARREIGRPADG